MLWIQSCWYCSLPFCVAVERQDSLDSAEYHSQLEDNREEEEEEEMVTTTTNKKGSKKKRHFSIFRKSSKRKSKDKEKNKLTLAAGLVHTLSVPGEASLSSVHRRLSSASLSNESEGSMDHLETQSDQEFAETLMNPSPRNSLIGTESRVGGNFGLRLLTGGEGHISSPILPEES